MSRTEKRREIARARERADLARLRFGNAAHAAAHRVMPRRLAKDAKHAVGEKVDDAKDRFVEKLNHWPFALGTAVAGAGVVAMTFWKPARVAGRQAIKVARLAMAARFLWRRVND